MTGTTAAAPWPALCALCLGFFLMLLDSTIVAVAVPTIAADFEASPATVVWVNSAYLFSYAVPLLVAGRLGDRFGPRRIYLLGLMLFVAASLACGLSPSLLALVISRIAQGLGAAMMTPQTLAIIRRSFPVDVLPKALGIWGSVGGVAAASGPLLGGVLIAWAGWPLIFLVNVPLGMIALIMTMRWVPRLERVPLRIPAVRAVFSAVGVLGIVASVHEAPTSAGAVWPFVVGGAGLVMLVVSLWQRRKDSGDGSRSRVALVPLDLLLSPGFRRATLGATSASFVVGAALIPVMIHLQGPGGLSVSSSTAVLLPLGVVSALTAPLAGACVSRWGSRPVAATGGAALVISTAACALFAASGAPPLAFALALAVFGFANSFLWGPFSVAGMTAVPVSLAGAGSAVYNATRQVGAVIGSAVTAAVLSTKDSATALLVLAVVGIVSVIAGLLLPKRGAVGAASMPESAAEQPIDLKGT